VLFLDILYLVTVSKETVVESTVELISVDFNTVVGAMVDLRSGGSEMKVKKEMSLALEKLGLMHVRKVSSQISLCSTHRLIRRDTFRFNGIFRLQEVSS
jgi:hypothetical protein